MNTKVRLIFVVAITFSVLNIRHSGFSASLGTSGARVLLLKAASRTESLAGAVTASGDDLSALGINPASISRIRNSETLFSQAFFFENVKFSYAAYAQPTKWGVPSLEYMNLSYGEFDVTNANRDKIGTQSPKDSYFGFGWSSNGKLPLSNMIDIGGSIRYVRSDLVMRTASALSLNFGGIYKSPLEGLAFGIAVNNLGTAIKYNNESFQQPRLFRLGTSYSGNEFSGLSARAVYSLDSVYPREGTPYIAAGFELFFMRIFNLQVGFDGEEKLSNRFRYGFGLGVDAFHVNYSAAPAGEMGTNHRLSLRMRFGHEIWNLVRALSKGNFVQQDINNARRYFEKENYERALFYVNKVKSSDPNNEPAKNIEMQVERIHNAGMAEDIYADALTLNKIGRTNEALNKMNLVVKLDSSKPEYAETYEKMKHFLEKEKLKQEIELVHVSLVSLEDQFVKFKGLNLPEESETLIVIEQARSSLNNDNPYEAAMYVSKGHSLIERLMASLNSRENDKKQGETSSVTESDGKSESQSITSAPSKSSPASIRYGKKLGNMDFSDTNKAQIDQATIEQLKSVYQRALELMGSGLVSEAIKNFKQVVSVDKNFLDASLKLSECYKSRGVNSYSIKNYDSSKKDFEEAIKLNPNDPDLKKYINSTQIMIKSMLDSNGGSRYE